LCSGFIGSHTVRALAELGESCVVAQRRSGEVPAHLAELPVVAEQADVADLDALRAISARHEITGVVHLVEVGSATGAVPGLLPVRFPWPPAEPGVRVSTHRALHVS
jgi:UDP-glucose 4-epimerase